MVITKDQLDLPLTIVTPVCTIYIKDILQTFESKGKQCSTYKTHIKVSKNSDRNEVEVYQPTSSGGEVIVLQDNL